jgi:hypothetical protein
MVVYLLFLPLSLILTVLAVKFDSKWAGDTVIPAEELLFLFLLLLLPPEVLLRLVVFEEEEEEGG